MSENLTEKQRKALATQREKENDAQERLFNLHREEIVRKYRGKLVAYVDNELYVASTRPELWKMLGNPGRGSGFIVDLRDDLLCERLLLGE